MGGSSNNEAGSSGQGHPNRDTVTAIKRAGFEMETLESFCPPVALSGLTPHVQGSARIN